MSGQLDKVSESERTEQRWIEKKRGEKQTWA